MNRFKNLRVCEKALDYTCVIRQMARKLPREEIFGLISQWRRAADSIVLNIAEGAGNTSKLEYARFLDISIRSGFECLACIDIAFRNKYIDINNCESLSFQTNEIIAMLYGLKKAIKK